MCTCVLTTTHVNRSNQCIFYLNVLVHKLFSGPAMYCVCDCYRDCVQALKYTLILCTIILLRNLCTKATLVDTLHLSLSKTRLFQEQLCAGIRDNGHYLNHKGISTDGFYKHRYQTGRQRKYLTAITEMVCNYMTLLHQSRAI